MVSSSFTRPGGVLLLCTLTALLLGACSSGGSTSSGPIVMSMLGPLTGSAAVVGQPILEGALTAAKQINDAGGILGRHLQMDQADTVGDPADAVPALTKELAIGHPVALIGPITAEINAVQPIFDRNQIVDGWQGGSVLFDHQTDKWLWRCNASDSQLGVAMADLAIEKGYTTAALFMSTAVTTQTLSPVIEKAFRALGGTILGEVFVTPTQSSYRSEVQKAINLHPQVFFTQLEPATGAVAFANFKELNNLSIPFIGNDNMAAGDYIKAVGPAVAKAHLIDVVGSNALTASGNQFQQIYQQVNGHGPLAGASYAYDCVIDFALAMTKAGTADPKVWVNDITAVSNPPGTAVGDYKVAVADIKAGTKINYEGVSGPMDFDQYHNVAGAWDVVQASGKADDGTNTLETISAATIQSVISKEGGG